MPIILSKYCTQYVDRAKGLEERERKKKKDVGRNLRACQKKNETYYALFSLLVDIFMKKYVFTDKSSYEILH
jgi:hypothetical protein